MGLNEGHEVVMDAPMQAEEDRRQLLRFALGGSLYCVQIEHIREILQVCNFTKVPMLPSFVCGVMNLRGAVVPVLDLSLRLGLEATQIGRRTCVVIVETAGTDGLPQRQGVLVDAVHEVMEVTDHAVNPVPSLGTRIAPQFISGVMRIQGQCVELLDVSKVLDREDLSRLVAEHGHNGMRLH